MCKVQKMDRKKESTHNEKEERGGEKMGEEMKEKEDGRGRVWRRREKGRDISDKERREEREKERIYLCVCVCDERQKLAEMTMNMEGITM